jgi:VIT1/CCC1 family predicted Fe2+/Mn2+ transporter
MAETSERDRWHAEMESAWLYRVVAAAEPDPTRKSTFTALAADAEQQALHYAHDGARFRPTLRARTVAALVRRFGPRRTRRLLAAMKVRGMSMYDGKHAGHEMPTSTETIGASHKGRGNGGTLRAAVFGVNDGLVSNTSLILGVAGAGVAADHVLLAGAAGLLAGAFSMAAGEYVSMQTQRELYEHQIGQEREELARYPLEEAEELALIYAARGVPLDQARDLTRALVADPQKALDTLAREELGLNPDDLGSPLGAAASSFASFAVGALVPLAPFALRAEHALPIAVGVSGLGLAMIGAALSLFSGKGAVRGGLRMLLLGAAAGGATFAIGQLLGVAV